MACTVSTIVTQMMKTTEHNYIYNGKNNKMSTSHTYKENDRNTFT